MMLGHKSKDDVTEDYIRVSDEMRLTFYKYAELIVGEKRADLGILCAYLRGFMVKAFFYKHLAPNYRRFLGITEALMNK